MYTKYIIMKQIPIKCHLHKEIEKFSAPWNLPVFYDSFFTCFQKYLIFWHMIIIAFLYNYICILKEYSVVNSILAFESYVIHHHVYKIQAILCCYKLNKLYRIKKDKKRIKHEDIKSQKIYTAKLFFSMGILKKKSENEGH